MTGGRGPVFDPGRGRLRLPAAGLTALAETVAEPSDGVAQPEPATMQLLRELGAVDDDGLHERLVPLATVTARPLARISLRIGRPAPVLDVEVWLGVGRAVASLPAMNGTGRDGSARLREVTMLHVTAVPDLLARTLAIGPRPDPPVTEPVVLPGEAVRALVDPAGHGGPDPPAVLEAAGVTGPAADALRAVAGGVRATWAAETRWPTGGGRRAHRHLEVIDADRAGWWQHDRAPTADLARLAPRSGRDIYRRVTGLIPPPEALLVGAGTADDGDRT